MRIYITYHQQILLILLNLLKTPVFFSCGVFLLRWAFYDDTKYDCVGPATVFKHSTPHRSRQSKVSRFLIGVWPAFGSIQGSVNGKPVTPVTLKQLKFYKRKKGVRDRQEGFFILKKNQQHKTRALLSSYQIIRGAGGEEQASCIISTVHHTHEFERSCL